MSALISNELHKGRLSLDHAMVCKETEIIFSSEAGFLKRRSFILGTPIVGLCIA